MIAEVGLALSLSFNKPDFPTVQQIAATCEQTAPCAQVRAQEAERLRVEADLAGTVSRLQPFGTYSNSYSFGQCTYYVSSRISVPEYMGNATYWSWGLNASGWRSGEPRRGAIGVSHLGWAGHVVIAEQVDGDNVYISEMNYQGWDLISYRWVNKSELEWFYP